jgi:hypothetical protein
MVTLDEIEAVEFLAVDELAKVMPADRRAEITKLLADLRLAKKVFLAKHPDILRKRAAAPKDKPTAALDPDAALGSAADPVHFRAPAHLCDMVLHLRTGHTMAVPASGIVEVAADHMDVQTVLIEQGFKQLCAVDRFGKSTAADPVQMFHRDQLKPMLPPFVRGPQQGAQ